MNVGTLFEKVSTLINQIRFGFIDFPNKIAMQLSIYAKAHVCAKFATK